MKRKKNRITAGFNFIKETTFQETLGTKYHEEKKKKIGEDKGD